MGSDDPTGRGSPAVDLERSRDVPDMTVLGAIERAGNRYGGWRQAVEDVVLHAWERTEANLAHEERAAALAGVRLEDERIHQRVDAVMFAALLGYCLGRTAGAGVETWDGWLERALGLAAFDAAYRIAPPDEARRRLVGAGG